jgi:hypothetical protein
MSLSAPECRFVLDMSLKKGTQGEDDAKETVSKSDRNENGKKRGVR